MNLPRNKKRFLLHFGNDMLFNLLLHIFIGGVNIEYTITVSFFLPEARNQFLHQACNHRHHNSASIVANKAVDRDQWLRSMSMDNAFHFTFNLCITHSESIRTNSNESWSRESIVTLNMNWHTIFQSIICISVKKPGMRVYTWRRFEDPFIFAWAFIAPLLCRREPVPKQSLNAV